MLIAQNLFRRVLLWPTEVAALVGSPSRSGAVDGQTDPAAIVKGFVAFGTADQGEQGLPRRTGIEPLGEIAQGIVTERSCHGECASRRRAHQRLRRNLVLLPTVSRIFEIPSEAKTPCHIVQQMTWRRTVHFFFFLGFLRSSASSCALAANTSRTA